MRLTPACLALATVLATCGPNDEGGFANQVTASPGADDGDSDDTADTRSSEAPLPTTSAGTTGGSTGDSTSDNTGDSTSDTGGTTGGSTSPPDDTSGTTTGEPVDDCPRVRIVVAADEVANVRPTPATTLDPVGTLPPGAIVDVIDVVQGEPVDGNPEWYQIQSPGPDGYVWGGLVECTTDEPAMLDGFYLPLTCGSMVKVSQGNNDGFSHTGQSAYAFDFSLGVGTPLVAIADGTVSHVYAGTKPGDPCYDGGGKECSNAANYVNLLHGDGTRSIYAHLSEPLVSVGQKIARGTTVGKSGSTGWSTGPHAHVARTDHCASPWCQSIPLAFADVTGDGVPETGDTVTSMNCP